MVCLGAHGELVEYKYKYLYGDDYGGTYCSRDRESGPGRK